MRTRVPPLALMLTCAAVACGRENAVSLAAPETSPAELKFVHANPDVGPIDVFVGGNKAIGGVPFGRSSARVPMVIGRQRVTLRSGDTIVDELDVTSAARDVMAVILTEDSAQAIRATPDTGVVTANDRANIRMINVVGSSAEIPTVLDVLITVPGLPADSVHKVTINTRTASHGPLMYFEPGTFRFRFVPQDGKTVLEEVTFGVDAGGKRSVVLEREASGKYRARVVIEP